MIKNIQDSINKRNYSLIHNGTKTKITVKRIRGFKDYVNNLAKSTELAEGKGFFIYNEYNFASFGMSENLDLIFVDWDGKIIQIEESFNMNKITKNEYGAKYIYVFPKNTIKKNKILINDTIGHEHIRGKSTISIMEIF